MRIRFVLAAAAFLLAACAATPEPVAAPVPGQVASAADQLNAAVYQLAAGDSVRVDVLGEAELSITALIDPAGAINYPFLGRIQAAGLTLRQLEQQIQKGLQAGYLKNPDVRVSMAAYRPVYVTGQVRAAGVYPYTLGLTVEKVLTLAGGVTQFASTRRIFLLRPGDATEQRMKVELDSPVLPGDTILVEERLF
jgi:polysaccharide export outer membrane protein